MEATAISYTNHGETFTQMYTPDQARKELFNFGYAGGKQLTDKQILTAIQEIHNF